MPWTNGTVETVNRDILQVLRVMILESQLDIRNWVHYLPLIQANHRHVPSLSKYASVGLFTGLPAPSALYVVMMPEHKLPPGIGSDTRQCVKTFFTVDGDAEEFTPSSISGISVSSEVTVVDLRQDKEEVVTATTNSIPDEILHYTQASNFIWQMIHKLEKPMSHKGKKFTHICLECLIEHHWKDSLCNATHTSNAKTHLLLEHKDHPEAVKAKNRRLQRARRFTEQPRRIEEQARDTKRQKKLWPASQDQIFGFIARWLIQDVVHLGLPYNTITTPAFRELIIGITGNSNVKLPSSKIFNDILDKSYDNFEKDTKVVLSKEFMELHEAPFLKLEHALCTNKSKNTIVGASCGFIDQQWKPRKLALLAQVKMMVTVQKK
ncbi:hypothetical protein PHPALM_31969 [Phytophthora palmivora]|uniref:Integrase catalytic domain-containing protein n=1 Tax=Phytophthora palmivora TaxID=4796 RepID=A0A2P4X190_9STRA|nr:hypothetical protein PHPALM_31969 [Phytophthora palmivora]